MMAGLPEGWEWDYDGTRWFYRYKPNGHIQYHFPKEGDEFPDYVDVSAPVPDLAPEELLESQQQVKRQTSTSTGSRRNGGAAGSSAAGGSRWKGGMSASARPVSNVWEDDADEDAVFQPESFMFLGPGTYTDVSPLAEEEEEAARQVVAGGIKDRVDRASSKGVSPVASGGTTPNVQNATPDPVTIPATVHEESVQFLDGREVEMPHELPVEEPARRFDPVGFMAEMPTHDTAPARIESNPDPVEMGDNMVLAPIETQVLGNIPELMSEPITQKTQAEEKPRPARTQEQAPAVQPSGRGKQPAEPTGQYQPYKPGMAPEAPRSSSEDTRERRVSLALQREASLMLTTRPRTPPSTDHPAVLSPPKVPPKHPLDGSPPATVMVDAGPVVIVQDTQHLVQDPNNLTHVPSVLKPARNAPFQPGLSTQLQPPGPPNSDTGRPQDGKQPDGGVTKVPSVLRPARGRAPSQPGQQPPFQATSPQPGSGYVPPSHGKHPPSMTPAPQPRPQQEPSVGIPRVMTVPEQMPSQEPARREFVPYQGNQVNNPQLVEQPPRSVSVMPALASTEQHRVSQQLSQAQQPVRPASVAPAIGGGQYQTYSQQHREPPYPPHGEPLRGQQPVRPASVAPTMGGAPYQPASERHDGPPQVQQPVRPASVMPALGGGQSQRVGQQQNSSPPYPDEQPRPLARRSTAPYPVDDHVAPLTMRAQTGQPAPYPDQDRPVASIEQQSPSERPAPVPLQENNMIPTPPSRQDTEPAPAQGFRRHSSFGPAAEVSPMHSRSGSIPSAVNAQTPSPLESFRRGSSQSANPNYTPSPVSSQPSQGDTPTPPSAVSGSAVFSPNYSVSPPSAPTNKGGESSYFPNPNVEGQGHAVSAQNKLRKKSITRQEAAAKRNSMPAEQLVSMMQQQRNPLGQSPLSGPSSMNEPHTAAPQGLYRSQSLRNNAPAEQQQQPPPQTSPVQQIQPHNNMVAGHLLSRIEEHEESDVSVSRPSTRSHSPQNDRRNSAASLQQSTQDSRRQSWQSHGGSSSSIGGRDSPGIAPVQAQQQDQGQRQPYGMVAPLNQMPPGQNLQQQTLQNQAPPQGQFAQGQGLGQTPPPTQPFPPAQTTPGYVPPGLAGNKMLQRKPSKAQAPPTGQNRAQRSGSMPLPSQVGVTAPGQAESQQGIQEHGVASQGPVPNPAQPPQGHVLPQGQKPTDGQPLQEDIPPHSQPTGQPPPTNQGPVVGQIQPQGPPPLQKQQQMQGRPPQASAPPQTQMSPGGPATGPPQGQMMGRGQLPPGQMPSPGQFPPQGQLPPGQMPPPGQQGQFPSGQMPMLGQYPPTAQPSHNRMHSQGQPPMGPMGPMPQPGQLQPRQSWGPNMQPPMPQGSGPQEKGKKWMKWFKGGGKSAAPGPATQQQPQMAQPFQPQGHPNMQPPPGWNGGQYMQPGAWQPAQPPMGQGQPGLAAKQTRPQPEQQALHHTSAPAGVVLLQPPDAGKSAAAPQPQPGTAPPNAGPAPSTAQSTPQTAPVSPVSVRQPAVGRQPSVNKRDSMSDTASMISTVEVSEAKTQPVLRPHVVHVQRNSQDLGSNQGARNRSDLPMPHSGPLSSHPSAQGPPTDQRPPPHHQAVLGDEEKPVAQATYQERPPTSQAHPQNLGPLQYQSLPQPHNQRSNNQGPPSNQGPPIPQGQVSSLGPRASQVPFDSHGPPGQQNGSRVTEAPRVQEQPVSREPPQQGPPPKTPGMSDLPSQQVQAQTQAQLQPLPPQPVRSRDLAPAPLFSSKAPVSSKSDLPSQRRDASSATAAAVPTPKPPVDDKWAKKPPVADYSGGDWGDEDDWDY